MSIFESIPIRVNSDTVPVDASWWNTIRAKLIEAFAGLDASDEPLTIANNQSSYQNITGLVLDKDTYTVYGIRYTIYRKDDTPTEVKEVGLIVATWKPVAEAWSFSRRTEHGEDALGIVDALYIDPTTGQAQYKSNDMAGANYESTFEYQIIFTS